MFRLLLLASALLPLMAAGCAISKPATTIEAEAPVPTASSEMPTQTPPGRRVMAPPTEGNLRVALGETAHKDGHSIQFVRIVEDSRCPANMTCVWQGRVTVELDIDEHLVHLSAPNGQQSVDHPTMVEQGEIQVWVIAVHPYPGSDESAAGAPTEVELRIGSAMH